MFMTTHLAPHVMINPAIASNVIINQTIYVNISALQLHRSSGVNECSINDHDFIFTVIKHNNVNNSSPKCITTRDLKHFDIQLYNEDLIEADLDSLVKNQADLDIANRNHSTVEPSNFNG